MYPTGTKITDAPNMQGVPILASAVGLAVTAYVIGVLEDIRDHVGEMAHEN